MMEKTFRPAEVEAKHYARWEQSGAFAARADRARGPTPSAMPPPNVPAACIWATP
jgi:valyl-tRNA synthetase